MAAGEYPHELDMVALGGLVELPEMPVFQSVETDVALRRGGNNGIKGSRPHIRLVVAMQFTYNAHYGLVLPKSVLGGVGDKEIHILPCQTFHASDIVNLTSPSFM